MIADLHIHTTLSDGSFTPSEALLEAKRRGLDCIALCDHDTTAGAAFAVGLGLRAGVAVIPGVEISAFDFERGRKIHLLGYRYSSPAREIERLCAPVRAARHATTVEQISLLADAGYPVDEEGVRRIALGRMSEAERALWPGVLYKQHVMALLIERGLTTEINGELYRKLFKGGGIAAREIEYIDVFAALAAIKADGGRAVLAHPGQQDSFDLVEALVAAGLDGIELYHEDHTPEHHRRILELARDHRLILTGGSDEHGALGSIHAIGDIRAPDGAAEALTVTGDPDVDWAVARVREARKIVLGALLEERDPARKGGDNRDLVTRYDTEVERILIAAVGERYPEDDILAEEREEPPPDSDGALWIIDPIDGTSNFVATGRDFAISVARYRAGRPLFGIVYDCVADVLYLGIAGRGSYRNGVRLPRRNAAPSIERADAVIEISVSTVERLRRRAAQEDQNSTQGEASPGPAALTIAHRAQRAYGCASLGLCRVAEGTLDIYLSARISVWDYAAATIVLSEVGGATAVELAAGEGSGVLDGRRAGGGDGASPAVIENAASLILHRERRFVVAAATHSLLLRTARDFFAGTTAAFIQTSSYPDSKNTEHSHLRDA